MGRWHGYAFRDVAIGSLVYLDNPELPPGTMKLDFSRLHVEQFEDRHVLIGDDQENIVFAPEAAELLFTKLVGVLADQALKLRGLRCKRCGAPRDYAVDGALQIFCYRCASAFEVEQ